MGWVRFFLVSVCMALTAGCGWGQSPTATPVQADGPPPSVPASPVGMATPAGPTAEGTSPPATATLVPGSTASQPLIVEPATVAPTSVPTSSPTFTRTPIATATVTSTPKATATATPTVAPTPTSTPVPPPTPLHTRTREPADSPTPTPRAAAEEPTPTPDRSTAAETFRTLPTSRKVVALTFDAGADVGYTEQILNTLRDEGVKASFGPTGKWVENNPQLTQRMADEGHMIFNHTYSHRSLTGFSTGAAPLTYKERADELWKTHSIILELIGKSTKPYFRPPYGDFDNQVLRDVRSRGYDYNLMWSLDSLGWKGLSQVEILDRVLAGLEPGAIYLFHVGAQSQDGPALSEIISALRKRGYEFARVDEYVGR